MGLLKSFRFKVTLVLIGAMLVACLASDLVIYKYAIDKQFDQLRNRLMIIAQVAALMVDGDEIAGIPLVREAVEDPRYKDIAERLLRIKKAAPSITYVYTLTKTERPGIFRFIVDPEPKGDRSTDPAAYPGEEYDAVNFPELAKGWDGPAADRKLGRDEWGVFMSGYAPVRDRSGKTVAILGVDMSADDVRNIERDVSRRVQGILVIATLVSILLGAFVSSRVVKPVIRLVAGTRHVARGELDYRVQVSGDDEVAELGKSFNKMAADLKGYIDQLQRTTAEKERLLRELEIAKGIQQSFLPTSAPKIDHIDIAAVTAPARVVGGDFYDFIPFGNNRWGIVVADVSGKGIPAALFMALSRTILRASTRGAVPPQDAIKHANRLIVEDNKANMFVTLFYAILDAEKMTLEYVNAGHNPPLLMSNREGDVILLKAQGVPLGVIPDINLKLETVHFKPGNILSLYTDGVTEAVNDNGERFELDHLSKTIYSNRAMPAGAIIRSIQDEMGRFVGSQPQFDDITLMVLKVL